MKINVNQETYLDRGGNPTIRELLRQLVFSPVDGSIKLNDRRLILQRASYGEFLREELIRIGGREEAFVALTRLGYKAGLEDAELLRKAWPSLDPGDAFTAGTRLHTLRGMVRVETIHNDFDFRKGKFSGDFLWHDSVEATEYRERHGQSQECMCWSHVGYASGYATFFIGKLVVYKEVQCVTKGDRACRVIGRPADAWGEDDPAVQLYRNRIVAKSPTPNISLPMTVTLENGAIEPSRSLPVPLLLAPVRKRLEQIARAPIPALITGAAGTGKRCAARFIHDADGHERGTFRRIHCAEIRDEGLDDLLSPRPGAAARSRRQMAKPGTLVFDGIERLNEGAQLRLAEMLERMRMHGEHASGVRLIAVSTLAPKELAALPTFRRDLLFRLSILPVVMPALRDRRDDIPALAAEIVTATAARHGMPAPALKRDAVMLLSSMDFPGNVPELEALIEGALLTAEPGAEIDAGLLRSVTAAGEARTDHSLEVDIERAILAGSISLDTISSRIYQTTIRLADGNVSRAARMLGLSRAQFAYRLGRAGLEAQNRPS